MNTKNLFITIYLVTGYFIFNSLNAQTPQLWGAPSFSGSVGGGTLVKMNNDGSNFTKVLDFENQNGTPFLPVGSMLQSGTKLYGVTFGGGMGFGLIYSYDVDSSIYHAVYSFDGTHGESPLNGMVHGAGKTFYGATPEGGAIGLGALYSFDPSTNLYTDLYDFGTLIDSSYVPYGSPILASDGKLYGIAGGTQPFAPATPTHVSGGIYRFDISTGTYTNLYHFGQVTDGYGYGSLIQLSNGLLYGLTSGNPNYYFLYLHTVDTGNLTIQPAINNGNLFSFDPISHVYTDLHNFDSINGQAPYGSLTLGADSLLYGTTAFGGKYNSGTIFSFNPDSNEFRKLFDFDSIHGSNPTGDLYLASDNNLYGHTYNGGDTASGVYFQFNPRTNNYTVLQSLGPYFGYSPMAGSVIEYLSVATDLKSINNGVQLSLYPIPASSYVTLHMQLPADARPAMNLFDETGRNVWTSQPKLPSGASDNQIDLSPFASGIYLLNVEIDGENLVRKIVLTRP